MPTSGTVIGGADGCRDGWLVVVDAGREQSAFVACKSGDVFE